MTLETTVTKKSYDGDDSTVAFPTTFIFWDVTDIEVILLDALGVETTWVEGTEYDLTGGSGSNGTVTVKTVPTDYTPATGEKLLIRSNRDDKQDDAFPLGGAFPSVVVEQAFDQLTRLIQQRTEELGRVLSVKKTSALEGIEVPDPVTGQILIGNAAEDGYDNITPSEGTVILNDNDLGTSQTQATSQNSILEFFKNGVVTMINKVLKGCHLQADDGTEILDPGTDGTDAKFTGDIAPINMVASSWPSFGAYHSANQSNITGLQKVLFNSEDFDTNANFSSSRFTPTVEGKYLLNISIGWTGLVDDDVIYLELRKSGAQYKRVNDVARNGQASNQDFSIVVAANGSTDYFEVFAQNIVRDTSGLEAAAKRTYFSGCRIG